MEDIKRTLENLVDKVSRIEEKVSRIEHKLNRLGQVQPQPNPQPDSQPWREPEWDKWPSSDWWVKWDRNTHGTGEGIERDGTNMEWASVIKEDDSFESSNFLASLNRDD